MAQERLAAANVSVLCRVAEHTEHIRERYGVTTRYRIRPEDVTAMSG
jgi:hypothetical protein